MRSGIAKQPVATTALRLDRLNLEGDAQADLKVHGGPDKAVYAYPSEHLADWAAELGGAPLGPAAFGENLSTVGATEDDVCVGDQWAWGDAVLEVCQPRSPCYKLALHRGRGDIGSRLGASGRTGWYLRVLEPGTVPTAGPITVVARHPMGATVRAMHEASRPGVASEEVLEALLCVEPLAEEWKLKLAGRRWG
ncbi:MAG: MOSC domain-containing protein [Acidimicrobiales bacterium]